MSAYSACFSLPCAVLGLREAEGRVVGIDFLSPDIPSQAPRTPLAREACRQLEAWLAAPAFPFDLPLAPGGTPFQNRVWQLMLAIPPGEVRTYGDLARDLGSSPRAVGQACGQNPIPVVIPCHRVVGKGGAGGFMHSTGDAQLGIKRWLLDHERLRAD